MDFPFPYARVYFDDVQCREYLLSTITQSARYIEKVHEAIYAFFACPLSFSFSQAPQEIPVHSEGFLIESFKWHSCCTAPNSNTNELLLNSDVYISRNDIGQHIVSLMNFLNERLLIFIAYNFRRQDWSFVISKKSVQTLTLLCAGAHRTLLPRPLILSFTFFAALRPLIQLTSTKLRFQYAPNVVYDLCVYVFLLLDQNATFDVDLLTFLNSRLRLHWNVLKNHLFASSTSTKFVVITYHKLILIIFSCFFFSLCLVYKHVYAINCISTTCCWTYFSYSSDAYKYFVWFANKHSPRMTNIPGMREINMFCSRHYTAYLFAVLGHKFRGDTIEMDSECVDVMENKCDGRWDALAHHRYSLRMRCSAKVAATADTAYLAINFKQINFQQSATATNAFKIHINWVWSPIPHAHTRDV